MLSLLQFTTFVERGKTLAAYSVDGCMRFNKEVFTNQKEKNSDV